MSNRVLQVYKSRQNLLELLKDQQYNVTDYENFGINEVDAMCANSQLDMILQKENDSHVYVNYFISGKKLSAEVLDNLVEDLFEIEGVLKDKKKDHIILIVTEEPNQTIVDKLKYMYDKEGYFILVFNMARLQFNILKHALVPIATILEEVEEAALLLQYHLTSSANLPEISRFDPQAMAIGLRPGQIVKLERKSPTAMNYLYYRVCV